MRKLGLGQRGGFTLVELSLAIALIGVLSIIVFMVISNAVSAYHRGLTLNQINTVGMELVDDMRSAVQSSPGRYNAESDCGAVYDNSEAAQQCINDHGLSFVYVERRANVTMGDGATRSAPVYGAFCTGSYSYIWNTGYFFETSTNGVAVNASRAYFSYRPNGAAAGVIGEKKDFRLLKVTDDNRAVCKAAAGALDGSSSSGAQYYNSTYLNANLNNHFNLACNVANTNSLSSSAKEICGAINEDTIDTHLLGEEGEGNGLALYNLIAMAPASSEGTSNMFYSVSFILGTVQGGINVMASGDYCATPEGYDNSAESFDYCAINKFNFAAQATGG